MKELYIVGAGGFSIEVLFLIERFYKDQWKEIYIIDDDLNKVGTKIRDKIIISNLDDFINNNQFNDKIDIIVTINNPLIRKKIVEKINNQLKVSFPNLIDKSLIFDEEYSKLGIGNIIMDYITITSNVVIGNFNIIGGRTGIGHDTIIGNFNTFSPRVSISGNVNIGDENTFGLNSAVLQNKSIGNNNNIWSYTMILKNVKDNCTYFGMPAKKYKL
jgi:sugar O-acyltransferase (sialic acid O-acetyltransferase NeuD family)